MIAATKPNSQTISVMFIKPFRNIPRFAVGFVNIMGEPVRYHKPFHPADIKVVDVPFSNTILPVPGDHIKPIKNLSMTNFKKLRIDNFTIDHIGLLEQNPISLSIRANGLRDTISKKVILNLLMTIGGVFPSLTFDSNETGLNNPVFTKIEFIGLRHIVPIVMSNVKGLYITVSVVDIMDEKTAMNTKARIPMPAPTVPQWNPDEPALVEDRADGGGGGRARARITTTQLRYGDPEMNMNPIPRAPKSHTNPCLLEHKLSLIATSKENNATFDGGPLNIVGLEANGRYGSKHIDPKAYFINLLSYCIKGENICVE